MLKVGVVGYYGYGNFGDEWMLATMRALAPDITFVPFAVRNGEQWLPEANVDAIIIGGGDLLIPIPAVGKSYFHPQLLELEKPILVFGVGVPLTVGYLEEGLQVLNSFLSHPNVKEIWFRSPYDYYVAPFLFCGEVIGKCRYTWDITFAYPHIPVGGNWNRSAALVNLAPRLSGMWSPNMTRRLEDYLSALGYSACHYIVLGWGETGEADWKFTVENLPERDRVVLRPTSVEDALRKIAAYDMLVTCKMHGVVAAALLGKRIKVLSLDNKFLYLSLTISGLSWDDFILRYEEEGDRWVLKPFERGSYTSVAPSIPPSARLSFERALANLFK